MIAGLQVVFGPKIGLYIGPKNRANLIIYREIIGIFLSTSPLFYLKYYMKYIPICVIIIKTLTNNIIQCIHTLIKSTVYNEENQDSFDISSSTKIGEPWLTLNVCQRYSKLPWHPVAAVNHQDLIVVYME
jgi:hypothetical protein